MRRLRFSRVSSLKLMFFVSGSLSATKELRAFAQPSLKALGDMRAAKSNKSCPRSSSSKFACGRLLFAARRAPAV